MKIYGDENNAFILKELGQRIKDTRIAARLSQKDFSDVSGLSVGTISRIESGQSMTFENFLRVLRALDLLQNLDILIPEQDIKPSDLLDLKKKKWKRITAGRKIDTIDTTWEWGE